MNSALILAGGASFRFGRPKPFELLRGKAMIRWVADAVASFSQELLISVSDEPSGRRLAEILPDARLVPDLRKSRGPIEGLVRGCESALGEVVIVAPCDAPLLRPSFVSLLLDVVSGHEAAVPRLSSIDPVRAVYERGAVLRALEEATGPVESPSALVDRLDVAFVEEDAIRKADPLLLSFFDVNVPEDLVAAERALHSDARV